MKPARCPVKHRRPCASATATSTSSRRPATTSTRSTARLATRVEARALHGRYAAEPAALAALVARYELTQRGVGARHAEALLACSYLVGMELPGRRALFSDLALDFDEAAADGPSPLDWSLRLD